MTSAATVSPKVIGKLAELARLKSLDLRDVAFLELGHESCPQVETLSVGWIHEPLKEALGRTFPNAEIFYT